MRMIVAAKGDQLTSPLDEKFHTDGYRWKFASAPRNACCADRACLRADDLREDSGSVPRSVPSRSGRHGIMAQVAIGGHLTIGEGAFLGGREGVAGDVRPGAEIWGIPGMEGRTWFRSMAWVARFPELAKRLGVIGKRLGLRKPRGGAAPGAGSAPDDAPRG